MASFVSTNGYVMINSVDLSDHVEEFELTYEAAAVKDTAMGDSVESNAGGLKAIGLRVRFQQDYASAKVDATLFTLVGTTVAVKLRGVNTTIGPTNPEFQTTLLLTSYPPVGGSVGELAKTEVAFVSAGVALTHATS